jgi:hypothetical protein
MNRRWLAFALILAGVAYAAWRGAAAFYWFEQWQRLRIDDPSAAELYQVNAWFELVYATPGVVVAILAALWLRRNEF